MERADQEKRLTELHTTRTMLTEMQDNAYNLDVVLPYLPCEIFRAIASQNLSIFPASLGKRIDAQIPTQNPEIPKKHRVYTNFFEKFTRTFPCFPVTRVRNPTEIVQINSFR